MSTFTNGKHPYNGKFNSSGQRKRSKLYAGLNVSFKEIGKAFDQIERERNVSNKKTVMSGKQDKKLRKEMQMNHREQVKLYREKVEEIAKRDTNMFRPKPFWFPMFLWVWILGFFIKIKR
ncbi:MAG: hypothetical protein WA082_04330 [Candidatus Moraniibacteriota bacterium]